MRTDDDSEQSDTNSSKAESENHFDPIHALCEVVSNLRDKKFCKALLNEKYLKKRRCKFTNLRKHICSWRINRL